MTYADYEWYLEQEFMEYDGQWVAIVDKRVVANNKNFKKVFEMANKNCPKKRPFFAKIKKRLSIL